MVNTRAMDCSSCCARSKICESGTHADNCYGVNWSRYRCLCVDKIEKNNMALCHKTIFDSQETDNENFACNEFEDDVFEDIVKTMLATRHCALSCSVVILGELSVGKSALCRNFFRKNLTQTRKSQETFMTNDQLAAEILEENQDDSDKNHHIFEMPVFVNGVGSKIKILDINTERLFLDSECLDGFGDLTRYLNAGDGYIVAYAVTDKGTFQTARSILKKIQSLKSLESSDVPIILVGNKCDLMRKRQVSTDDGIKLAEKFQVKFIETSATLHQNVDKLFEGIITQIRLRGKELSNRINSIKTRNDQRPLTAQCSKHREENYCSSASNSGSNSAEKKEKPKKESLAGKCLKKFVKTKCQKNCQDFSIL